MEENELISLIGRKLEQGLNDTDGDISDERIQTFDYYMGEPFGTERAGYSSVVSREVFEVVEWAKPSILRVFTAGDRIVSFDPVGPEDEDFAEQETDITNHVLKKQNNAYVQLSHWISDALMYPNGYIKVWVEEVEKSEVEEYEGLSEPELAMLVNDDAIEIEWQEEGFIVVQTPVGPVQEAVYSVRLRRTFTEPKLRLEAIPPDQLIVDNDCLSIDLDEANFIAHRVRRSHTWLVEYGLDPDELESVGLGDNHEWNDERVNRLFYEDENPDEADENDESMKEYWVHEVYLMVDFDGDGLAERRRVLMVGDKVFENEEDSYQPFTAMSSILMAHKHTGMALADTVKDLQLIMSTLKRQLLDNIYKLNVPRKYVGENAERDGGITLDALLNTASEYIPVRDPTAIVPETHQSLIGELIPAIQFMNEERKMRSGIAPELSLDADTLQQSTMGAFMGALDEASQRLELITRNFAETGFKQLMCKIHRLMREHMHKETAFKIRGTWIPANPANWREREDVSVNVGLGFNNKHQKVQLAMGVIQLQKELLPLGMVDHGRLYNALEDLIEASGKKDANRYFLKEPPPPQPQQPDPQMLALQLTAQVEGAKVQLEREKSMREDDRKRLELLVRKGEQELKALEASRSAQRDAAQLESANAANALKAETERYKADLAANTTITVEQMRARESVEEVINGIVPQILDRGDEQVNQAISRMMAETIQPALSEVVTGKQSLEGVMAALQQVSQALQQPVQVVVDEQGNPQVVG